ncbi:twin-arginine translocation signal domain-containing protein [Bradyrhizobium arachidis]|uniref:twin-arginine translocation signal domain-containing protein n=1 Tax=Bradyrhizobium arachidis TaxID=858423 RepID=UPI00220303EB|nr:twin-arginine translocation signal domain-containing protein [Bradyrhizobium arachidis]
MVPLAAAQPGFRAAYSGPVWDTTWIYFGRRTFLKRSGVAAGALAALGNLPLGGLRKAEAGPPPPAGATVNRHALDTAGKIERPGNRIRISCVHPPVSCGASAWRCTVTGAS